jgi:steroid 5-alpha reductase family enzyme
MKSLAIIALLALLFTWAGSQGGRAYSGVPIFAASAAFIFMLQWLAFIPAYVLQTEVFYDLTGSITYISVVAAALFLSGSYDPGSLLIAACVLIWALRLGTFLFRRILEDGSDGRFDKLKPAPLRFFVVWNLQALWVLVCVGCALAAISSGDGNPVSSLLVLGCVLWVGGFVIEVVADHQKRVFRKRHGRDGFVQTGLWRLSRHPNYLGEILLWLGIAIMSLPALQGWQHLTLVSPVFVCVLLTRISGVPLLERKADRLWGEDPAYQAYKDRTPVLVPRLAGANPRDHGQ